MFLNRSRNYVNLNISGKGAGVKRCSDVITGFYVIGYFIKSSEQHTICVLEWTSIFSFYYESKISFSTFISSWCSLLNMAHPNAVNVLKYRILK